MPVRVDPAGWTTRPAGLSTIEQVLVLPDDRDVELLGGCSSAALGDLDVDLLPALEPEALRPRLAVDEHGARRDQALGERARVELGPLGENAVEPRPGVRAQERESGAVPRRGLVRSDADERGEQQPDADDDEGVGEIERRPVGEVEEVGDVTEPDPVDQVRDAAADHEPERDREQRVALGRAG